MLELRDNAFDNSAKHHERMRHELRVFQNNGYSNSTRVGGVYAMSSESLDPKIQTAILRLIPAFREQMPRIEIQPDKSARTEFDIMLTQDIQNWYEMMEEVDDEGEPDAGVNVSEPVLGHCDLQDVLRCRSQGCAL